MRIFSLFLLVVLPLFLPCHQLWAAGKQYVVVIDAGHGGKDFGACRGQYKEKDINLGVAMKLGQLIENNMPEVKVVYTRKTDVFIELDQRSSIANKARANLFISIHTNSTESPTTNASGAETYILGLARSKENLEVAKRENSVILMEDNYSHKYEGFDPKSPESYIIFEFMTNKYMEQSYEMASYVQNEFRKSTNQRDKGVRQAGFLVLRKSGMPSLLVEVGFINNTKDGIYISSSSGQSDLARAICNAFKKYKREFDKKQGNSSYSSSKHSRDEAAQAYIELRDSNRIRNSYDSLEDRVNSRSKNKQSSSSNNRKTLQKDNVVQYKVQFLISPTKLSKNSSRFKGLSPVEFYIERGEYKYTYGVSGDMKEIVRIQKEVGRKFKDAFIVKFMNGEKVNN